ncbi:similar to Saccharomyces cerevisiae YKL041W VPS24 One of four subunits of the endosomal sorting complex required for transport III (ESCRT-III) [Maudiozyma barnettii]|uniref:Similar to Saccharomyces cerevisiae YKL041W VPS24 One of four subunits of the endosomal sorting complex required for transport III (ESCRT-III) n=1 Tax=Maudiozyma barnettii TaxID=61262 RepID=A0A8H2VJ82_9SACH|nr:ESCRT-III subunit protein VPS24 [Kazachstania barnettii]CAB4256416.1 similar to Saccharomyces cerevisiae YKL041W VPS24 One of four subunits of the endosomal sorting complex required for transport III (ESCRT-III) [Kazachstania barnettii]CAD1785025.1 similar to Saccharomyces cerevisiae YKL041W VPS24 One of four subunits of the endosomal sorting complex required for transport III (ESCRT-III) [Kazachstania barnettii]
MDYFKKALWGPDEKEQHRKIKGILRKNGRSVDRSLNELSQLQNKSKQLIRRAAKKNDIKTVKIFAKELYGINKQYSRLYTSKAQLESVGMKIEEAYKMKTLTTQMANNTDLMREVNSLVRLPQIRNTMVELEKELMKSGIITEMIDDTMESIDEDEELDEEVNEEVNKIVEQYTTQKFAAVDEIPTTTPELPEPVANETEQEVSEENIDEEADKMLSDMKERLRALQS